MNKLHKSRILIMRSLSSNVAKAKAPESKLRPTIGLEIHAQLAAKSKMFSDAPVDSEAPANQNVSLFDLSTPGTLPTLNRKCVQLAIRTAYMLNCAIASECRFDRKHYFYPDMPSGYQITQKELPIAHNGWMFYLRRPDSFDQLNRLYDSRTDVGNVRIKQVQMEMDSGKMLRGTERDLVDLNRVGVGLVEIVTEPDFHSAAEAVDFAENLRLRLQHHEICHGEMQKGQFRVDANISLSETPEFGNKVELKNLNSFESLGTALRCEIQRQTQILTNGGTVDAETRGLNSDGETFLLRSKDNALDYRFLPEPNLPRLRIPAEWINAEVEAVFNAGPAAHLLLCISHQFSTDFALRVASNPQMLEFVAKCLDRLKTLPAGRMAPYLRELEQMGQANNVKIPLTDEFMIENWCSLLDVLLSGELTHLNYVDYVKAYITGEERKLNARERITADNLWALREENPADLLLINESIEKAVASASAQLLEKARHSPNPKHFNKVRRMAVEPLRKRLSIELANKLLRQRLSE